MLPSNVLVYFARGCFSFFVGLGAYRGAPFPTTGRGLGDPRHTKSRQSQQGGVPWLRSPDQLGRGAARKAGKEGHASDFHLISKSAGTACCACNSPMSEA